MKEAGLDVRSTCDEHYPQYFSVNQLCSILDPTFENPELSKQEVALDQRSELSTHGDVSSAEREALSISPFMNYYDGYTWPNIYAEVCECLESCALIYPLSLMRQMARDNKLEGAERFLELPLSHAKLLELIDANESEFTDEKFADDFYREMLRRRSERVGDSSYYESFSELDAAEEINREAISITSFNDDLDQQELVYSVAVDHHRKRVTVCFRGSVTKADWATDSEIYMKELPNPMRHHDRQEGTLKIHHAFFNYLLKPSPRATKTATGTAMSPYQEILQDHVLPAIQELSGYKLYVTGHSLGAALATLFAFKAAPEPDWKVPKPVSLISFASPYVGDQSFRAAHQLLEGGGKLRHLRVSNHKDFVTLHPKVSFRWQFFNPESHVGSLFKHVGMHLLLGEGRSFDISYPKVDTSLLDELSLVWSQACLANLSWNPVEHLTWPSHRLREYHWRLLANQRKLSNLQLNDFYSRKDLVGDLVAQTKPSVPVGRKKRKKQAHVILLSRGEKSH